MKGASGGLAERESFGRRNDVRLERASYRSNDRLGA